MKPMTFKFRNSFGVNFNMIVLYIIAGIIFSIFFIFGSVKNSKADSLFLPGLWQFHFNMTFTGSPYPVPPVNSTYNSCIGEGKAIPLRHTPSNCPMPTIIISGRTAKMTFECSTVNHGVRSVMKEIVFESFPTKTLETMNGNLWDTIYVPGRTINQTGHMHITGRRIGSCSNK